MMERDRGALHWAREHTSDFALEKTALIGFTRKKEQKAKTVKINGTDIKPVTSHKFLGVIFDEELRWREQRAKILKSGTKWAMLIKRVSRINHGFTQEAARRLHQSVFIPKVTYAAEIWWDPIRSGPSGERNVGAVIFTKRLQSAQRHSALNITGALRTSPTDAVDVHAGIYPVELELRKACHRAAIRLATPPINHPLRKRVDKEGRKCPKAHQSPMHALFKFSKVNVDHFQPHPRTPKLPKALKKLNIIIAESKEEAEHQEKIIKSDIKIFTDGSMVDGKVGAAAVLLREGREPRTLKLELGADKNHEVYEAEILGLQLGLQLLLSERPAMDLEVAFFIDNQAVLKTIRSKTAQNVTYLFTALEPLIRRAEDRHIGLQMSTRWIPGHIGVAGNEMADKAAKEAAKGIGLDNDKLPTHLRKPIPTNPTAAKRSWKTNMAEVQKDRLEGLERTERMRKIDAKYPSFDFSMKAAGLPRQHYATLVQLQIGHFPTASYLRRFGARESSRCNQCEQRSETIMHYLMDCEAYTGQRARRDRQMGGTSRNIKALLTPGASTKHLMEYVYETGRMKRLQGRKEQNRAGRNRGTN